MRCMEKTTIRIDDNLKTRIRLLAINNNFMNKMIIYLLELGYNFYVESYEKEYRKIKMEGGYNLWLLDQRN